MLQHTQTDRERCLFYYDTDECQDKACGVNMPREREGEREREREGEMEREIKGETEGE